MNWRPVITVAAVVERDAHFLIVEERIDGALVFNQPAGRVEDNESLLSAVIREMREETAWRFRPEALVGIYTWRKSGSQQDTLRFAITGSVADHDGQATLDHPIIATHWLTRAELVRRTPQLRSPLVLRCVDDYLAGRRGPLASLADLREPG
jgi:8-oxo-dGTP pyrophosphatase MutT (NUDIX family)